MSKIVLSPIIRNKLNIIIAISRSSYAEIETQHYPNDKTSSYEDYISMDNYVLSCLLDHCRQLILNRATINNTNVNVNKMVAICLDFALNMVYNTYS